MARNEPLKITLTARAAAATGRAFVPWGTTFADPDVALDEVAALRAGAEPLILRVLATGGNERERARLRSEWFCDSGGAEPVRTPKPKWNYGPRPNRSEAAAWARRRTWALAWELCEDARWMLHAAAAVGVSDRRLVSAMCACAYLTVNASAPGETRPFRALEAADRWARGGVVAESDLREASAGAVQVMWANIADRADNPGTFFAADAAAVVCSFAVAIVSDTWMHPSFRSGAASSCADQAANARPEAKDTLLRMMADLVRREIPTDVVLRAATSR